MENKMFSLQTVAEKMDLTSFYFKGFWNYYIGMTF